MEKGQAVSAVILENAKIFWQLTSKSRSLAETRKAKTRAWILKKMSGFNRAGHRRNWTDLER